MFNVVGWVLRRRSEGWHRLANMGIVEQAAMILVLANNTSFDSGNYYVKLVMIIYICFHIGGNGELSAIWSRRGYPSEPRQPQPRGRGGRAWGRMVRCRPSCSGG